MPGKMWRDRTRVLLVVHISCSSSVILHVHKSGKGLLLNTLIVSPQICSLWQPITVGHLRANCILPPSLSGFVTSFSLCFYPWASGRDRVLYFTLSVIWHSHLVHVSPLGWVKCRTVVNWQCYSFTEVVLQSSIIIYSNSYYLLSAYCASGTTLSTHTYVHLPSTPHYLNDHPLSKATGEAVFYRCTDWALVRVKS